MLHARFCYKNCESTSKLEIGSSHLETPQLWTGAATHKYKIEKENDKKMVANDRM